MTPDAVFTIETTLPIKECLRRLDDAVDEAATSPFDWNRPYRGRDYAGRISEQDIQIYRRASNLGSFRPMLLGSLHRSGGKTSLRYRIAMAPRTAKFMALWLGAVGVFLLMLIAALQFGSASTAVERGRLLEGIALCCAFGAIGSGLLLMARLKAPQEGALLARAVTQILDAADNRNTA